MKWRVQTGDAVRSSPAVTATRVFVGSGDGGLYAIDRASGTGVVYFATGMEDAPPGAHSAFTGVEETLARGAR